MSGQVVDAAPKVPIVDAIVAAGTAEVTTGEGGVFELAGAGTRWLDVVVVADGYEPLVQRVRVGRLVVLRSYDGNPSHSA